jgi:hypothetical protein
MSGTCVSHPIFARPSIIRIQPNWRGDITSGDLNAGSE